MTIHGSKKNPFSFQEIKHLFPQGEFEYRDEKDRREVSQSEVGRMEGKGFVLMKVKGRHSAAWKVDISTLPAEEILKLEQWTLVGLRAN